jgi:hypothetical protein
VETDTTATDISENHRQVYRLWLIPDSVYSFCGQTETVSICPPLQSQTSCIKPAYRSAKKRKKEKKFSPEGGSGTGLRPALFRKGIYRFDCPPSAG